MKAIKPFPTIEEVFKNPEEFYKLVFFPLLTIDLEALGKGTGKVHFISVYGDGDPDIEFEDNNMNYDFIRFKRNGDKYLFDGDLTVLPHFDELESWHNDALKEFEENKDEYLQPKKDWDEVKNSKWKKNRELSKKVSEDYDYYISGLINYWVTRDKYFETGKFIQGGNYLENYSNHEREFCSELDDEIEFNEENTLEDLCSHIDDYIMDSGETTQDKKYIGACTGYNYIEFGEDEIYLFVDEQKNEAVQYFIWT